MKLAESKLACVAVLLASLLATLLVLMLRPRADAGAGPAAGAPQAPKAEESRSTRLETASATATESRERFAADAPAEAPAPTWRGRVRTAAGAPVAGAVVLLAHVPGFDGDPGPSGALDAASLDALESIGVRRARGATLAATRTDAAGRFRLDAAWPERVALFALHRAHGVARRGPDALPAAEEDADLGALVLAARATLAGEVRDPNGRPCVGLPLRVELEQADGSVVLGDRADRLDAEVFAALAANDGLTVGRTQSDVEGRFRFEGLVPGSYVVELEGRHWGSGHRGVFHTGEFASIGDGHTVHVRVVDQRGAPVRGAYGELRGVDRQVPAPLRFPYDDERGYATVGAGEHQLVVAAEGAAPYLQTLAVDAAQPAPDVTAQLSFEEPGTVTVRVPDDRGPVAVHAARVLPPAYAERAFRNIDPVRISAPAQDGRAVLTLAPGPWRFEGVFADAADGEPEGTEPCELEIFSGRSLELQLELPESFN